MTTPTSRTLAFSGNSLPYGYLLATPDDIGSQYDRALRMCYGDGVVTVIPHGLPFNAPGMTCEQLIRLYAADCDTQLRADPTGLAVMVHNEYVNDRVLAEFSMEDTLANGRRWCNERRLPGRVRTLNTTMSATPWDDPAIDIKFQRFELYEKYAIGTDVVNGKGVCCEDVVDLRGDVYIGREDSIALYRNQYLAYPPGASQIHRTNLGYAREKMLGFDKVARQLDLPPVPDLLGPNGSLLSYWRLSGPPNGVVGNENPGGFVLDHWGTQFGVNHMSKFPGGSTPVYTADGSAALFNATSGFLQTFDSLWPMFTTLDSVQFRQRGQGLGVWFKPEDSTSDKQLLAGIWTDAAWKFCLSWDGVGRRLYSLVKGDGSSCTAAESVAASPVLANDEWYFAFQNLDGYRNRLFIGDAYGNLTEVASAPMPAVMPLPGSTRLAIGGTMYNWRAEAEISDVSLCHRAASLADIKTLYKRGNHKGSLCA